MLAPFSPTTDKNFFRRLALDACIEVVWWTCVVVWLYGELVWLYGCMAFRLNVTQTKDAFWLYSGSGRLASRQASMMRPTPLPQFSKNVVLKSTWLGSVGRNDVTAWWSQSSVPLANDQNSQSRCGHHRWRCRQNCLYYGIAYGKGHLSRLHARLQQELQVSPLS